MSSFLNKVADTVTGKIDSERTAMNPNKPSAHKAAGYGSSNTGGNDPTTSTDDSNINNSGDDTSNVDSTQSGYDDSTNTSSSGPMGSGGSTDGNSYSGSDFKDSQADPADDGSVAQKQTAPTGRVRSRKEKDQTEQYMGADMRKEHGNVDNTGSTQDKTLDSGMADDNVQGTTTTDDDSNVQGTVTTDDDPNIQGTATTTDDDSNLGSQYD